MLRLLCPALLLCFALQSASAHPPTSLVADSRGNLFFSDLNNVWMVSPAGEAQIVVRHVHAHELYVDAEDRLFGEDVTNVGDLYRHRVWVRRPDGSVTNVLDWRGGHPTDLDDYSFVRNAQHQFVLSNARRSLEVRTSNGWGPSSAPVMRILPLPSGGNVHFASVSANGIVFVAIGSNLWRWDGSADSRFTKLTGDLSGTSDMFSFVQDRHALMGMWPDESGGIYVADYRGRRLWRVLDNGTKSVVYRSDGNWSPSGGMIQGPDLLVLEWSVTNQGRVVRIRPDGSKVVYSTGSD